MLRRFFFFLCFISLIGADFLPETHFQLSGTFKHSSYPSKTISFLLNLTEKDGFINGVYEDDFFSKGEIVYGENSLEGAQVNLALAKENKGTKSLVFFLPELSKLKKSGDKVTLITRDQAGYVNGYVFVQGLKTNLSKQNQIQLQEEDECKKGFGEIAGYCGIYAGVLTEVEDRRNFCNLLIPDPIRFELNEVGSVFLHVGEVNELISSTGHLIGRIPYNPQKNSIDIMSRKCESLIGVKSSVDTCKILHLYGTFSKVLGSMVFKGKYKISEEGSNRYCIYKLSFEKRS